MAGKELYRFKTITEYHRVMHLPKPEHPLISLIDYNEITHLPEERSGNLMFDFYAISIKEDFAGKMRYGQQQYDFDEGIMFFGAPQQVFSIENEKTDSVLKGWMLLIHPDFIWNTSLAKQIKQYEFFDYAVNEALFLSDKEEDIMHNIVQNIKQEYHSNIDQFSQNIIISQIETLLNYSERFYQRQFITRKKSNHQILNQLEELLNGYFKDDHLLRKGLPTVQFVSDKLNVSPNYLSGLLKSLSGQSTQQHIHEKLIEKAKERLSTTYLSVSEIAYELGFEHAQSFSKLFKLKTDTTPLQFRQRFSKS